MSHHPNLDAETAHDFACYADLADTIDPIPTMEDQDPEFIACARRAAERLVLNWPPDPHTAKAFLLRFGPQYYDLINKSQLDLANKGRKHQP